MWFYWLLLSSLGFLHPNVKVGATFLCPRDLGNFPHPELDTKFYHCIAGQPILTTCPAGGVFLPDQGRCSKTEQAYEDQDTDSEEWNPSTAAVTVDSSTLGSQSSGPSSSTTNVLGNLGLQPSHPPPKVTQRNNKTPADQTSGQVPPQKLQEYEEEADDENQEEEEGDYDYDYDDYGDYDDDNEEEEEGGEGEEDGEWSALESAEGVEISQYRVQLNLTKSDSNATTESATTDPAGDKTTTAGTTANPVRDHTTTKSTTTVGAETTTKSPTTVGDETTTKSTTTDPIKDHTRRKSATTVGDETTTERTTKAGDQATTEITTKAGDQTTTKSTTKSDQTTRESTTRKGAETTTERTTKAGDETTTERTTKAGAETTTERTTKAEDQTTTERTTKAGDQTTTESTTKAGDQTTTKSTTKAGDQTTTESTTKSDQTTTERTTKAGNQTTTERTTRAEDRTSTRSATTVGNKDLRPRPTNQKPARTAPAEKSEAKKSENSTASVQSRNVNSNSATKLTTLTPTTSTTTTTTTTTTPSADATSPVEHHHAPVTKKMLTLSPLASVGRQEMTKSSNTSPAVTQIDNDGRETTKSSNTSPAVTQIDNEGRKTTKSSNTSPAVTQIDIDERETTKSSNTSPAVTQIDNDERETTKSSNTSPAVTQIDNNGRETTKSSNTSPTVTKIDNDRREKTKSSNTSPVVTQIDNDRRKSTGSSNTSPAVTQIDSDREETTKSSKTSPAVTQLDDDTVSEDMKTDNDTASKHMTTEAAEQVEQDRSQAYRAAVEDVSLKRQKRPNDSPRTRENGGQPDHHQSTAPPASSTAWKGNQSAEDFQCPDQASRHHPHPEDCTAFFQCTEGKPYLHRCREGTAFDQETGLCSGPVDPETGCLAETTQKTAKRNHLLSEENPVFETEKVLPESSSLQSGQPGVSVNRTKNGEVLQQVTERPVPSSDAPKRRDTGIQTNKESTVLVKETLHESTSNRSQQEITHERTPALSSEPVTETSPKLSPQTTSPAAVSSSTRKVTVRVSDMDHEFLLKHQDSGTSTEENLGEKHQTEVTRLLLPQSTSAPSSLPTETNNDGKDRSHSKSTNGSKQVDTSFDKNADKNTLSSTHGTAQPSSGHVQERVVTHIGKRKFVKTVPWPWKREVKTKNGGRKTSAQMALRSSWKSSQNTATTHQSAPPASAILAPSVQQDYSSSSGRMVGPLPAAPLSAVREETAWFKMWPVPSYIDTGTASEVMATDSGEGYGAAEKPEDVYREQGKTTEDAWWREGRRSLDVYRSFRDVQFGAGILPLFRCPGDGLYADPFDCSVFYLCSRGKPIQYRCQPGTLFDKDKQVCSWTVNRNGCDGTLSVPYRAPLQQRQSPSTQGNSQPAQEEFQCRGELSGFYPHPEDCMAFFHCVEGTLYNQRCGRGTVFDPETSLCSWPTEPDANCLAILQTNSGDDENKQVMSAEHGTKGASPNSPPGRGQGVEDLAPETKSFQGSGQGGEHPFPIGTVRLQQGAGPVLKEEEIGRTLPRNPFASNAPEHSLRTLPVFPILGDSSSKKATSSRSSSTDRSSFKHRFEMSTIRDAGEEERRPGGAAVNPPMSAFMPSELQTETQTKLQNHSQMTNGSTRADTTSHKDVGNSLSAIHADKHNDVNDAELTVKIERKKPESTIPWPWGRGGKKMSWRTTVSAKTATNGVKSTEHTTATTTTATTTTTTTTTAAASSVRGETTQSKVLPVWVKMDSEVSSRAFAAELGRVGDGTYIVVATDTKNNEGKANEKSPRTQGTPSGGDLTSGGRFEARVLPQSGCHRDGLYADPFDCSVFYLCSQGKPFQHRCQPGTLFDKDKQVCSWTVNRNGCDGTLSVPYRAPLQQRQSPSTQGNSQPAQEEFQCRGGLSGFYPHPEDCRAFFHCVEGRLYRHRCGKGTAFDPKTGLCSWFLNPESECAGIWRKISNRDGRKVKTSVYRSRDVWPEISPMSRKVEKPVRSTKNVHNGQGMERVVQSSHAQNQQHAQVQLPALQERRVVQKKESSNNDRLDPSLLEETSHRVASTRFTSKSAAESPLEYHSSTTERKSARDIPWPWESVEKGKGGHRGSMRQTTVTTKTTTSTPSSSSPPPTSAVAEGTVTSSNTLPRHGDAAISDVMGNTDSAEDFGPQEAETYRGTVEERDFHCPSSSGDYPDLVDCAVYHRCRDGRAFRRECPPGKLFHIERRRCLPIAQVTDCHRVEAAESDSGKETEWRTQPPVVEDHDAQVYDDVTPFRCPTAFGLYRDSYDCSVFYRCFSGRATRYVCQFGTVFSPESGQCAWSVLVPECQQRGEVTSLLPLTSQGGFMEPQHVSQYNTGVHPGDDAPFLTSFLSPGDVMAVDYDVIEGERAQAAPGPYLEELNLGSRMDDFGSTNLLQGMKPAATVNLPDTSSAGFFCPSSSDQNKFFPDPVVCSRFHRCIGGLQFSFDCPRGTVFNDVHNACDFLGNVRGCDITGRRLGRSGEETWRPVENNQRSLPVSRPEFGERMSEPSPNAHPERLCLEKDGLFPHPTSCRKFVYCSHGTPVVLTCPPNLLYNRETMTCDGDENIVCIRYEE